MTTYGGDDRGVSDVVSFVLVFALVISSVGLVTTLGLGTLQGIQQSERAEAAENAFVVLSWRLGEVEDSRRPAYRGDLDLSGATLAVTNGTTLTVNVTEVEYNESIQVGALQYRTDDVIFTYESGGVFRQGQSGSVVVAEPSFVCREDQATVSLVELRAVDSEAVGGSVANVRVERATSTVRFPEDRNPVSPTGVTVDTASDRWQSYFERNEAWTGTGPYTCSADEVSVRRTVLLVELRS